jgi:hypothetical protein
MTSPGYHGAKTGIVVIAYDFQVPPGEPPLIIGLNLISDFF